MRQDRKYFAEWLDRTLIERGIAGGEVAKALEVNDSAVSRWRNGKASPGLESVRKLASFLGVTPPVRLVVTAGLMSTEETGVAPLPLPDNTKTRVVVIDQIMNIKGLTQEEKEILKTAYESTKG